MSSSPRGSTVRREEAQDRKWKETQHAEHLATNWAREVLRKDEIGRFERRGQSQEEEKSRFLTAITSKGTRRTRAVIQSHVLVLGEGRGVYNVLKSTPSVWCMVVVECFFLFLSAHHPLLSFILFYFILARAE